MSTYSKNNLYLCVSEAENNLPFHYDFSLVTGNASNIDSLTQHNAACTCRRIAPEENGQARLSYHHHNLLDSSQRVLTLIKLASVKNEDLLYDALYKFDPDIHTLGVLSWYLWALTTLIWENRTGKILEFDWVFDIKKVEEAAEGFTYYKIVKGGILEELGDNEKRIPVWHMEFDPEESWGEWGRDAIDALNGRL